MTLREDLERAIEQLAAAAAMTAEEAGLLVEFVLEATIQDSTGELIEMLKRLELEACVEDLVDGDHPDPELPESGSVKKIFGTVKKVKLGLCRGGPRGPPKCMNVRYFPATRILPHPSVSETGG